MVAELAAGLHYADALVVIPSPDLAKGAPLRALDGPDVRASTIAAPLVVRMGFDGVSGVRPPFSVGWEGALACVGRVQRLGVQVLM